MGRCPWVELPRERWVEFRRATVVDTSLQLIHHVACVSECGRTVGLGYAHIAEIVRALHPGARTGPESLRWYKGHAFEGDERFALPGRRLPQLRPRFAGPRPRD